MKLATEEIENEAAEFVTNQAIAAKGNATIMLNSGGVIKTRVGAIPKANVPTMERIKKDDGSFTMKRTGVAVKPKVTLKLFKKLESGFRNKSVPALEERMAKAFKLK